MWTHDELLQRMRERLKTAKQRELAADLGVSESVVSKVLSGELWITSKMAAVLVGRPVMLETDRRFRAA